MLRLAINIHMINLHNFVHREQWPTFGFMSNHQMLSDADFEALSSFDFRKCQVGAAEGNRKSKQYWKNTPIDSTDQAEVVINRILHQLDDWEVLKHLTETAMAHDGLTLSDVWTGDIEDMKANYLGVFCSVHEDNDQYELFPHLDSRPILQIYISPDGAPVGTYFHEMEDHTKTVQLPFKANTGYFQLNLRRGVHSVKNIPGVTRRSIIFGWNMMYNEKLKFR